MSEINFREAKEKVKEIQGILSRLDHAISIYLRPYVYSSEGCTILLSESEKSKLANEYLQIKAELESKTGELPE